MKPAVVGIKEALPYLRLYKKKTFIIKIGGGVLARPECIDALAQQIGLFCDVGIQVVIVHGGGPQASEMSRKLGHEPKIVAGRRVTDDDTLDIVKQVYAGKLNVDLVSTLIRHDVRAVGLTGIDGGLLSVNKRPPVSMRDDDGQTSLVDFGHVGDIMGVNPGLLESLLAAEYVPVIASLGGNGDGEIYNINADTVAESLAKALQAKKLIFATTAKGVLRDKNDDSTLIPFAEAQDLEGLLATGAIAAGMRPKVEACLRAVAQGVKRTHIISGLEPDTLLKEVFSGEGCGTMIVAAKDKVAYQERELV